MQGTLQGSLSLWKIEKSENDEIYKKKKKKEKMLAKKIIVQLLEHQQN